MDCYLDRDREDVPVLIHGTFIVSDNKAHHIVVHFQTLFKRLSRPQTRPRLVVFLTASEDLSKEKTEFFPDQTSFADKKTTRTSRCDLIPTIA